MNEILLIALVVLGLAVLLALVVLAMAGFLPSAWGQEGAENFYEAPRREPSLVPLLLIVFFVGAGVLLYFGPGAL